ncbi:MAG: toxic anion resistance protein [Mogibacterium sp.]|nr:toxic anion resistance protein [Mogibacterium sp.]
MEDKFEDVEVKAPDFSLAFDGISNDALEEKVDAIFAEPAADPVPTLEIYSEEPEVVEAPAAPVATETKIDRNAAFEAELTESELAQVNAFVDKIDVSNSQAILNYGVGTQKKIADFSEKALENVRAKDMGEVGTMITSLVTELRHFDEEDKGGIFGFFKKKANNLEAMKLKYSKVETNIEEIQKELEKHQVTLMKDSAVLDRMYEMNLTYYKELSMYILAGYKKLDEVRANELAELQAKAARSGLPEDAQAAKDLASQIERFEKKLHDLELTRTVAMQTAPQIRMVQASDNVMAEKIQSTIVNTIPLWKNQMVIAMGIEHSTQAAKAQREVTDMTNELLKKNADSLKQATVETAREAERGIVDIETLRHTNEQLISTLDEVMNIQQEGREKRMAAQAELTAIENQLKQKLLEASQQVARR